MKVAIHPKILSMENIDKVWLNLNFKDHKVEVYLQDWQTNNFVEVADKAFKQCTSINFKVQTKASTDINFKFKTKSEAVFKPNIPSILGIRTKQTKKHNKQKYFSNISLLSDEANKQCIESQGTKNLIYYSVYFEGPYLDLLNLSAMSILFNSAACFDILIITDKQTKQHILKLPFVQIKKPKFHLTKTPLDGVEASINKIEIFNYKNISKYKNILYIDTDIIAQKNIDCLFKQEIKPNVLYTASNKHITVNHFKTKQHGFTCLPDSFVNKMKKQNQKPFNAGQFLFQNTQSMKAHFQNIKWMIENWSGDYFFEQCFMNYYFCKAGVAKESILQDYVDFVITTEDEKDLKYNKNLIHFISPPLNGNAKLNYIKQTLGAKCSFLL